jgi:hypothetical protein
MDMTCQTDVRRDAVRSRPERVGLDYVEVDSDDRHVLYAYFLGGLPKELAVNRPGIERHVRVEGGDRITGLRVIDVDPQPAPSSDRDSVLVVRVDRPGDMSRYTLRLVDIENLDARYDEASFSFAICCPSDLDCKPRAECAPATLDEPQLSYLAKDYASFRQLMLDRLAVLMPEWTERHAADIGITLVELLAYVADQLSYYQDAVATEAYIGTARQRISIRRHARLVDYALHEGCNARAWVHVEVSGDVELPADRVAFITGRDALEKGQPVAIAAEALSELASGSYELFEPLVAAGTTLRFKRAHNEIHFYTWGNRECCLNAGATHATLRDAWVVPSENEGQLERALSIAIDDVLIFEEARGAKTGVEADRDPERRWAVRVTRVTPGEDPVFATQGGRPIPVLEIEWAVEDALPFALCLRSLGRAPDCAYIEDVSVVRGNVVLVDHGRSLDPEPLPPVPSGIDETCCECEGQPSPIRRRPARFRPALASWPVVFREPLAPITPAARCLDQDPRAAVPQVRLIDEAAATWWPRPDLIASTPEDRVFVVENDNAGASHLRFGDGELGRQPLAGSQLVAHYRTGGGARGNVGAEAIARIVLEQLTLTGIEIKVRNPISARGGTAREPIEEARHFAPLAFRAQRLRAIIAADYAELAARNTKLQRASARLVWTGSWYEADVAIDPLAKTAAGAALIDAVAGDLHRYRRMGHDVHVQWARYVPIQLSLEVCALPGYDPGHVKAALLERFGNRVGTNGARGFFHADELSFGESIHGSRIVAAAQAVTGVECVTVTALHRRFAKPNREIENGLLPLASYEIAQLDNDPNHPERGQLQITVKGGRP